MSSEEKRRQELLQAVQNTRKIVQEKQNGELNRKVNEEEMKMLNDEFFHCQFKIKSQNEIINTKSEKDRYNEFRGSCQKIVRLFKKFDTLFYQDYKSLMADVDEIKMRYNMKLKNPERLIESSDCLQFFCNAVQSLSVITDEDLTFDFSELQETVIEKNDELKDDIIEIITEIESLIEDSKNSMKRDVYLKRVKDIESLYRAFRTKVVDLSEFISKFDIPLSQKFGKTIDSLNSISLPGSSNSNQTSIDKKTDEVADEKYEKETRKAKLIAELEGIYSKGIIDLQEYQEL